MQTLEARPTIYYLKDAPGLAPLIQSQFLDLKVEGIVLDVAVNVRVGNRIVVYVFIDREAAERCEDDMALPSDVGLRFADDAANTRRHPRLWLRERKAEVDAEVLVAHPDGWPQVKLEWVTFLKDRATGRTSVVG